MSSRPFILSIMTLLLTVVSSIVAYGQIDYSVVEGGGIHYRLSGTQIDTGYLSNRQNLKLISTQQNIGRVQILQAQK